MPDGAISGYGAWRGLLGRGRYRGILGHDANAPGILSGSIVGLLWVY